MNTFTGSENVTQFSLWKNKLGLDITFYKNLVNLRSFI